MRVKLAVDLFEEKKNSSGPPPQIFRDTTPGGASSSFVTLVQRYVSKHPKELLDIPQKTDFFYARTLFILRRALPHKNCCFCFRKFLLIS